MAAQVQRRQRQEAADQTAQAQPLAGLPAPSEPATFAASAAAESRALAAAPAAASYALDRSTAERWLAAIILLRHSHHDAQANAELADFRLTYPTQEVPRSAMSAAQRTAPAIPAAPATPPATQQEGEPK